MKNSVKTPWARLGWLRPAVASAIVVLAGAALAVWAPWRSRIAPPGETVRFEVGPSEKMTFTNGGAMAVSPDGRWMVFPAKCEDGVTRYWLRALDGVAARMLPGTDISPAPPPASWSWDSRYVIFVANRKLKKIDIQGGLPQTLAEVPGVLEGAAWNRDGVIVIGAGGPLLRVPASGGVVVPATALDPGEVIHYWPQFLPDGRHFLYYRASTDPNKTGVYIGSIDAKPDEQDRRRLLASDRQAYYAPSSSGAGHLLFLPESTLMAQPFDPVTMALGGEPAPIAEGVNSRMFNNYGMFSVSDTGTLVYRGGGGVPRLTPTWVDLQGHPAGTLGEPGEYANPAVSPDGTRVAVGLGPAASRDIWLLDVARGTSTQFTFDPASDDNPVWSPDGKALVFSSSRSGRGDLYIKPADGSGDERLLFKSDALKTPTSWSGDGRFLLFTSVGSKTAEDIWALPMHGDATPLSILQSPFSEDSGRFSPDGRWMAYASAESGTSEIYVRPFAPEGKPDAAGVKWLVSRGGNSSNTRWRADGKALYYTTLDLRQMVVDIDTSQGFQTGTPRKLFATPPQGERGGVDMDLAPDGKRFLYLAPPEGVRAAPFTVVLNWAAALKK